MGGGVSDGGMSDHVSSLNPNPNPNPNPNRLWSRGEPQVPGRDEQRQRHDEGVVTGQGAGVPVRGRVP